MFNFNTQPYGATTPEADPAKALAVRQAVADLVDREAIADAGLQGHLHARCTPSFRTASPVPPRSLKDLYGDGDGGPDADKAKAILDGAGVTDPGRS